MLARVRSGERTWPVGGGSLGTIRRSASRCVSTGAIVTLLAPPPAPPPAPTRLRSAVASSACAPGNRPSVGATRAIYRVKRESKSPTRTNGTIPRTLCAGRDGKTRGREGTPDTSNFLAHVALSETRRRTPRARRPVATWGVRLSRARVVSTRDRGGSRKRSADNGTKTYRRGRPRSRARA